MLIVEDEAMAARYIAKGLAENGFVANVAATGNDGLHLALTGDYVLILLDVMLPDMDGWTVLARLRGAGKHTPVLFLTARDAVPDRVKGLELGADDYLVKPFAFSELLARVCSVLRRGRNQPPDIVTVADVAVDLRKRKALHAGQQLDLTPKEFALLALLMQHQGDVMASTTIAEHVWDINFDRGTSVIEVAVRRLRTKVDAPFERKLLHTVRGVGCVLDARD